MSLFAFSVPQCAIAQVRRDTLIPACARAVLDLGFLMLGDTKAQHFRLRVTLKPVTVLLYNLWQTREDARNLVIGKPSIDVGTPAHERRHLACRSQGIPVATVSDNDVVLSNAHVATL